MMKVSLMPFALNTADNLLGDLAAQTDIMYRQPLVQRSKERNDGQ